MFFLPTVTEEYQDVDIPICAGMEVVANSVQDFGKWARRVRSLLISSPPTSCVNTHRIERMDTTDWYPASIAHHYVQDVR